MDQVWLKGANGDELTSLLIIAAIVGVIYVYFSITLTIIAAKAATPHAWLAWVPVANFFLMCWIGRRSSAWGVAMMVPCLNIIAAPYVWCGIAQARGYPPALGLLILVPGLNFLLPLILAIGRGTPAAVAPAGMANGGRPTTCPNCRKPVQPGDAFCGECGARLPALAAAPPSPAVPAQASNASCCLVSALVLVGSMVAMAGACGVGAYFLLQPLPYSQPARLPPAIPAGIAGTISVLPRDSDLASPARPVSFTSQTFGEPARPLDAEVRIPQSQLPPGVEPSLLPQVSTSATSAVYQAQPGGPTVNIQVLSTSRNRGAAGEITNRVTQATGGGVTGISVENAVGGTFTGTRIEGGGSTIYILWPPKEECVILISTAHGTGDELAARLAAALGNGEGIADPQFEPYVCVLPAFTPPDLTLEEVNGISGSVPLEELTEEANQGDIDPELRNLLTELRSFIGEQITVASYRDLQNRPWTTTVCTYSNNALAWRTWQFVRWIFGWNATGPARTSGVAGLYFNSDDERLLIFCKGPYLVILHGPAGAPLEQFEALGNCLQL